MILVTGSKGMLGSDIMIADSTAEGADIEQFDITDLECTLQYIGRKKPDVIINCAAYTNVDGCETEISTAYKVNAIGARNIAVAANNVGAKLIHISTDYVFDGEADVPYTEGCRVNPLNVYGKSKLDGENFVKTLTNKHFIVRTQWLYGANGKNFVKTMLALSSKQDELNVVDDQFGCPTYTRDLAAALLKLADTQAYGTYHLTNDGIASWYGFAKTIFKMKNIKTPVNPISTSQYPTPATRPCYSVLNNLNWELSGFKRLRYYGQALEQYLMEEC